MKLVKPNYKSRSPVVNEANFTDQRPSIGSASATFNPASKTAKPFIDGPPRFVQVSGKRVRTKGLTNKRY